MSVREPAWRVLAQEFQASLEEEKGTGDRAASYLLSPLGARMNRVLLAGTLSAPESIGKDPAQPFLRAKLSDPTGTMALTAGGFQPRALSALQRWTGPQLALVVGKAHLYRGRDGVGYGSVRIEALRPISEAEYRMHLAEAADHAATRLRLQDRLRGAPSTEVPPSEAPRPWVDAAKSALRRYPQLDRGAFERGIENVLATATGESTAVHPASDPAPRAPPPPGNARVTRTPPVSPRPPPSAQERAAESSFLDIVDELTESSVDGYADLKEVLARAAARGLPESAAEELLNRLEESGVLEEPVVGKLRRA
ncbi:MAG TPA: hypothetical protein VEY07_09385 [Thermoplasmata archaeon]|nr:hypothetical protein [Thermoplasmata archaeon]